MSSYANFTWLFNRNVLSINETGSTTTTTTMTNRLRENVSELFSSTGVIIINYAINNNNNNNNNNNSSEVGGRGRNTTINGWKILEQSWRNGTGMIDMESRITTVVQFCIIASVGVLLNSMPILILTLGRVRRGVVNSMIANLSSIELLLCLSFIFGQTFYVLWHEFLPPAGCHFLSFIHFVAAFASFMFPPLLSLNRYIYLYHRNVYKIVFSPGRSAVLMVGFWTMSVFVPLAFLIGGKTGFDVLNAHCCMVLNGDLQWTLAYWFVIITPLVVFCDGSMLFCNYKIYKKLKRHGEDATMVVTVVERNKEVLYFLLADMLFPICFHSVYHICKFAFLDRTEFWKRFFISLYLLNSVARGCVTLTMLRPYRTALRALIGLGKSPTVQPTDDRDMNGKSIVRQSEDFH